MKLQLAAISASIMAIAGAVHATPITLAGNYLEVGISDAGTFGSDYSNEPGILHDPTGTGNFCNPICNDYLTPGSPHDGYAVNSDQTGFVVNDNQYGGGGFGSASPVNTSSGSVLSATWTNGATSGIEITNTYTFNKNSEQIKITTTLTNLTGAALTNLYFGRSEDPDPDVYTYGTYNSVNTRGDATHAANQLVSAAGYYTGLTIGILNDSTLYPVNTSISYSCCSNSDPAAVFNGTDYADYSANFPATDYCDCGLQMAWDIGTLGAGASATIDYEYVFGTNQGTVGSGAPEPAAWALMLIGVGAIGGAIRRRSALA
jgi:PEP-CTERM motif